MSERASLASVNEMVLALNINELRSILRDMGFSVEGSKEALQKRLTDSVSHSSNCGKAVKLLIIETISLLCARKNAPGITSHEIDTMDEKSVHNIAKRYVDLTTLANQPHFKKKPESALQDNRNTISPQNNSYNVNVPISCSPTQSQFNMYRAPISMSPILQPSNRNAQHAYMQPQTGLSVNCNTTDPPMASLQYRNMLLNRHTAPCNLPPTDKIGCLNPYGVFSGNSSVNGNNIAVINPNVQINNNRPPISSSGSLSSNPKFFCNRPQSFEAGNNQSPHLPPQSQYSHSQRQQQPPHQQQSNHQQQQPQLQLQSNHQQQPQCQLQSNHQQQQPPQLQHQLQQQGQYQISRQLPQMNKANHVVSIKPTGTFTFYQSPFYMIDDYIHQFQTLPNLMAADDAQSSSTQHGKRCLRSTIRFNLQRHAAVMTQELFTFDINDMTTLIEDGYPSRLVVYVNKRPVHIPGSFVNPDKEPRRPHIPLNISDYLKLTPNYPNVVNLEFVQSSSTTALYYAIVVVRKIDPQYLVSSVFSRSRLPTNFTKSLISKQLFNNNENDLNMVDDGKCNRVSLLCPLSMTRIKIPIRHSNCQHFQCFDLESYINMNDLRPTWQCPICDIKAYFHYVYVDGFFEEILRNVPQTVTHILFNRDLTYTIASEPKAELQLQEKFPDDISNEKKLEKDIPCVIIIDDDDDCEPAATSKQTKSVSNNLSKDLVVEEQPKSNQLKVHPDMSSGKNNSDNREINDSTKNVDNYRYDPETVAKVIATHDQTSQLPDDDTSSLKDLTAHNELTSNMPEALVNPSIVSPDSEKSSTPNENISYPKKMYNISSRARFPSSSDDSDSDESTSDSSDISSSDSYEYDADDDDVIIID